MSAGVELEEGGRGVGEEWEEWGNKINSWQVFEFVFVEKPTVNHSDTLEEKKKVG